jgi:hypothetical protein
MILSSSLSLAIEAVLESRLCSTLSPRLVLCYWLVLDEYCSIIVYYIALYTYSLLIWSALFHRKDVPRLRRHCNLALGGYRTMLFNRYLHVRTISTITTVNLCLLHDVWFPEIVRQDASLVCLDRYESPSAWHQYLFLCMDIAFSCTKHTAQMVYGIALVPKPPFAQYVHLLSSLLPLRCRDLSPLWCIGVVRLPLQISTCIHIRISCYIVVLGL